MREVFTDSPQCFDRGRKSLRSNNKSKAAAVTTAPSGTPGVIIIESSPEEAEVEEIKLVSVFRTPLVDSRIRQTDVQSNIKILLLLSSRIQAISPKRETEKKAIDNENSGSPGPENRRDR
ncbi:hypothetical protein ACSAZL_21815 [Methanosarcina sp. T3]|uniref:hypothetical protein n=1 Tax=Methanosarcina sp. T3 TaxID=3439062 RepID=UPI003F86DAD7